MFGHNLPEPRIHDAVVNGDNKRVVDLSDYEELTRLYINVTTEYNDLNTKYKNASYRLKQIEQQQTFNSTNNNQQYRIDELEREKTRLRDTINSLENDKRALNSKYEILEDKYNRLKMESTSNSNNMSSLDRLKANEIILKIQHERDIITNLYKTCEMNSRELKSNMEEKIANINREKDTLQFKYDELLKNYNELTNKCNNTDSDDILSTLKMENEFLKQENDKLSRLISGSNKKSNKRSSRSNKRKSKKKKLSRSSMKKRSKKRKSYKKKY
jgi:chromosome segregation ATPase